MRRAALVVCMFAAVAVWPAGAQAAGGTYTLVQCDPLNRASDEAQLEPTVSYAVRPFCGSSEHGFAIRIENVLKAQASREGSVYWEAPPGTSIVDVTAQVQLRNDSGSRARAFIADAEGREVRRIANGDSGPADWQQIHYEAVAGGHERFAVSLTCENDQTCPQSDKAKALVRNVKITLVDEKDPALDRVSGSLFGGGWLRGEQSLDLHATDGESGLTGLTVSVGSTSVRSFPGSCPGSITSESYSSRFRPCGDEIPGLSAIDTKSPPLHDGANSVAACASDFASNTTCRSADLRIDNTDPQLAFDDDQSSADPELIRATATDQTSGVDAGDIEFRPQGSTDPWQPLATQLEDGLLTARVDSASLPPGAYEFLAHATDVAGNSTESALKRDGEPKVLEFPLRSGVQLTAEMEPGGSKRRTVGYGHTGDVAGKLLSASGSPLAHRDIAVIEHFGDGALLSKRRRIVTTDSHGNWTERVPPGPSRRITASFAGDQRYLAVAKQAGRLLVRSRANFRTSRKSLPEGQTIVFKGRIGHLGAHIPPGGKLVEVQVRERPGRWNTVREALYTNEEGRYRMSYRFGRFYVKDARFRFRLKVTREQGWPYKAPIHSRQRAVIVRAHK